MLNVGENRVIVALPIQAHFRQLELAFSIDCNGDVDAARQGVL